MLGENCSREQTAPCDRDAVSLTAIGNGQKKPAEYDFMMERLLSSGRGQRSDIDCLFGNTVFGDRPKNVVEFRIVVADVAA